MKIKSPLSFFFPLSIVLVFLIYGYVILSQEGSPIATSKAMFNVTLGDKKYDVISENKYLFSTFSKEKQNPPFKDDFCFYDEAFCKDQGLKFVERMGAEVIFEKDNNKVCALNKSLTRKFYVLDFNWKCS